MTVGRFRQFVNAWKEGAGYAPRAGSGKHTHLNGGMGLANSASPETYEPGWIPSDDDHVEPTDANLTCWTGISDGAGAPDPWSTWTRVAGTQENLPVAGAGDDTGMGGVTRGMAAAFLGLRAWLWHAGRVVTSVVARGSVRRCPSYARARAISSPFAE